MRKFLVHAITVSLCFFWWYQIEAQTLSEKEQLFQIFSDDIQKSSYYSALANIFESNYWSEWEKGAFFNAFVTTILTIDSDNEIANKSQIVDDCKN